MTYNPNIRADHDGSLLAPEIGALVDQTVKAKAVAAAISQGVSTNRPSYEILSRPVDEGVSGDLRFA